MLLRRTPGPFKGGPSEKGLNTLENALSNGVGPNHRLASRTASVRFEVDETILLRVKQSLGSLKNIIY